MQHRRVPSGQLVGRIRAVAMVFGALFVAHAVLAEFCPVSWRRWQGPIRQGRVARPEPALGCGLTSEYIVWPIVVTAGDRAMTDHPKHSYL